VRNSVRYSLEGNAGLIKLSDPGTLNAISMEMADDLGRVLDRAAEEARAILLTGEGRGFCSGANLNVDVNSSAEDYDAGASLDAHYNPLVMRIRNLPIPIVVAVNGAAAGIGAAIALSGDLIVASETSYFLQSFRRIGLVPDGGSAYLLVNAEGRTRAMEMMLLGERVGAQQALAWGLVNRVVPDDQLIGEATSLAASLASGPTKTLGMIRRLCWQATEASYTEMLAMERDCQRAVGLTADHREGVSGFLVKRIPSFSGK